MKIRWCDVEFERTSRGTWNVWHPGGVHCGFPDILDAKAWVTAEAATQLVLVQRRLAEYVDTPLPLPDVDEDGVLPEATPVSEKLK